jgi:hypothetical protein
MENRKMKKDSKIKKNCRTLFPIGFGARKVENNIIILNFLDTIDDENNVYEIISSIAMSKDRAKLLIKALSEAIDEDENESA